MCVHCQERVRRKRTVEDGGDNGEYGWSDVLWSRTKGKKGRHEIQVERLALQ